MMPPCTHPSRRSEPLLPLPNRTLPAEERPSTVVFKTHQRAGREVLQVGLHDNVADEALLPSLGPDVDQADAVEAFAVGGLVVVAEQLVATANREDLGAVPNRAL